MLGRKMLRRTDELTRYLVKVADSPAAYRPGEKIHRTLTLTDRDLNFLGDLSNLNGTTSGDFLVVSVTLIEAIDDQKSFRLAMDRINRMAFESRELKALPGFPIAKVVNGTQLAELINLVGLVFRAEAYREWVMDDIGGDAAETDAILKELAENLRDMGGGSLL